MQGMIWHGGTNSARHSSLLSFASPFRELLFRSDNNPIPFVRYEDGRSKADFEYGYADALADGVCRPIYFPSFEGRIRWLSFDGNEEDCSLLDSIARAKAAERLRAALSSTGDWLRGVIREADAKLTALRADGHPTAAGLVIAIDQEHAKRIGQLLVEITGAEPFVAISEDPDASEKIKQFAENCARWIVSVRMISEGVDIPRLRVGVYATNVTSELFFRQAVGRLVRMIKGLEEQGASLYIPAEAALVWHALRIKEERDHQLAQEIEEAGETLDSSKVAGRPDERDNPFTPLTSEHKPHDTIFDGACFDPSELAHAELVSRELGIRIPITQVAALLRRGAAAAGTFVLHSSIPATPDTQTVDSINATALTSTSSQTPTKAERKQRLRRNVQRLANQLAHIIGTEAREIHREWIKLTGKSHDEATEEDFRRKQEWLIERIKETRSNERPAQVP